VTRDSRVRMVRSAASLIGSRGLNGTSFADVIAASGAPRGSIYHHFPRGKSQLAEDAIEWISDVVLTHIHGCPASTPADVLTCFAELWRQSVLASRGSAGCPVAGVAIDNDGDDERLKTLTRDIFESWVAALAGRLEAAGVEPSRAVPVAQTALATMEGALILCRAEGNVEPLETVTNELVRFVSVAGV
jgi:TetR/AcrR family transcriptional regulator, lmrAB and yxaGH operons repressor